MMIWLHSIIDWIDRQVWLDQASQQLQKLVVQMYESGGKTGIRIRDFIHGTWLGHPLHPVITDIPLGAWTAALTLDALEMTTGKKKFGSGADAALTTGLVGAAGAAVAGLTDWQHTTGRPRRVGMMHALLNTTSLVFYIFSLLFRKQKRRQAGWGFALLGFSFSAAAAYLGGHLTYGLKIGVDRSPDHGLPEDFTPVMPENELRENVLHRVVVNNNTVLVVRNGGHIYALAETCSHMGGPLSEGELVPAEDGLAPSVVCPWHASRFSLQNGEIFNGPSTYIQPCFQTRVRNGQVEVRVVKDTVD